MTTVEWIGLIVTLIGGFWVLTEKLGKIEKALVGRVTYEDCSDKRDRCPCVREFNSRMNESFRGRSPEKE